MSKSKTPIIEDPARCKSRLRGGAAIPPSGRTLFLLLGLLLCLPLGACAQDTAPDAASAAPSAEASAPIADSPAEASYEFDQPVASFTLPDELREISGLTVLDDRSLGAVQDEEGNLYVLDRETGEVTAVVPFGPPGDYEGLELAGDRLFVLRADGVLLEMEGWQQEPSRVREHDTGLGTACDAEGIAYDAAGRRLLIACKEGGGLGERRAIYAFDLERGALVPEPAFVLDPETIPGDKKLAPSAMAVHPASGHLFVLSSARERLVALAPDGTVAQSWDVSPARFEQPEGLAFLPNGDLFIASEGGDGAAVLKRFAPGSWSAP